MNTTRILGATFLITVFWRTRIAPNVGKKNEREYTYIRDEETVEELVIEKKQKQTGEETDGNGLQR